MIYFIIVNYSLVNDLITQREWALYFISFELQAIRLQQGNHIHRENKSEKERK